MSKVISISLSPNVFNQDLHAAWQMMRSPLQWQKGEHIRSLEGVFASYLGVNEESVFSFNSGRSAFLSLLSSLGIGNGDEVLLQAFTCNAVPNPVLWSGAKPVYVDVREATFSMDARDLEKKITPRSRAIIIQHTFGLAGDLLAIKEIARRRSLIVIEDCAHALGGTSHGKRLGTFGDAAFFSFGRDKVISCVYGGMLVCNNATLKATMSLRYEKLAYPSKAWIRQQLRHPQFVKTCLRLYALYRAAN